jgi:hypothetical protein
MINLNAIDLEATVKELAWALANYMDGVKDHDIQSNTGLDSADCDRIAKAKAMAGEIIGFN